MVQEVVGVIVVAVVVVGAVVVVVEVAGEEREAVAMEVATAIEATVMAEAEPYGCLNPVEERKLLITTLR